MRENIKFIKTEKKIYLSSSNEILFHFSLFICLFFLFIIIYIYICCFLYEPENFFYQGLKGQTSEVRGKIKEDIIL